MPASTPLQEMDPDRFPLEVTDPTTLMPRLAPLACVSPIGPGMPARVRADDPARPETTINVYSPVDRPANLLSLLPDRTRVNKGDFVGERSPEQEAPPDTPGVGPDSGRVVLIV